MPQMSSHSVSLLVAVERHQNSAVLTFSSKAQRSPLWGSGLASWVRLRPSLGNRDEVLDRGVLAPPSLACGVSLREGEKAGRRRGSKP